MSEIRGVALKECGGPHTRRRHHLKLSFTVYFDGVDIGFDLLWPSTQLAIYRFRAPNRWMLYM